MKSPKRLKILLTGSSGQVGQALQARLSSQHEVIAPQRGQMDLSNRDAIDSTLEKCAPDLIINPAAYTAVDQAESDQAAAHSINALAPAAMAQYARKHQIGLIHFSTDYVFNGESGTVLNSPDETALAYTEEQHCQAINVYGQTKRAGELAIIDSGCKHLILRTSWVYSLHGKNFLLTMLKLAQERSSLNIVNDQWGAPTSADFLAQHTCNIIEQNLDAENAEAWWQTHQGVYHLCPSGTTNWLGFASEIMRLAADLKLLKQITPTVPSLNGIPSSAYPTPAKRPHNSRLDTQKFQAKFGLQLADWQSVLRSCLAQHPRLQNQQPPSFNSGDPR